MDINFLRMSHRIVFMVLFLVLPVWAQPLDVRSVRLFGPRRYERTNIRSGCSRVVVPGHETLFSPWACSRGEREDAVRAAIRYVRYQRQCTDGDKPNSQSRTRTADQGGRLSSPSFQFSVPLDRNFSAYGVSVHDMDVHLLPFQIKNSLSCFPLHCILVAFLHEEQFLFAIYVNVNTGRISPDFGNAACSLLLEGESRYPFLTKEECQKQDEAVAHLFKPIMYEVTAEQFKTILKRAHETLSIKTLPQANTTNDVEVLIEGL